MKRLLQDKFLIYRVRVKKDPDAFGKIYDTYAPKIYRFVFFKVSSKEEAQDITAEVFLKAWQYLLDEKGKDVRHLNALLYSIARNKVIDYYRSKATKDTVSLSPDIEDTMSEPAEQEKKMDIDIGSREIEKQLRSLKDEYREVLVMKYLDEMEAGEIASALGKTSGNVRVLLHRAMVSLRKLIENNEQKIGSTTERSQE